MTKFAIVPQWQGSPSTRAMQLIDGNHAIAGDLPTRACIPVPVPAEAGDALDTQVHRYSALHRVQEHLAQAIDSLTEPVMVIGGDCSVGVPAIAHAATKHERLAVLWCDAHPDLHTPDSSPSGAFSGMALRAILGDGAEGLRLRSGAIPAERVILFGARDADPAESEFLRSSKLSDVSDTDGLVEAVSRAGVDAVYIHVDLDVLDPAAITGVTSPVPFGLQVSELTAAIARVRDMLPLAGSSVTGFAPSSPDAAVEDLGAILRIVGALA